jgi:hypothetical protein
MGAGSLRIRDSLLVGKDGFVAQAGFDDSVKFHLRRRRSPPPSP